MAKVTPTQRSLKYLRSQGYLCAVVERRVPYIRCTQDLWGIGDILAVKGDPPDRVLVQCTTGANLSHRIRKIMANERLSTITASGIRVEVHGWRRLKVKRGGKAYRWELDKREIGGNINIKEA